MGLLAIRLGYKYSAVGGTTAPYWMWSVALFQDYNMYISYNQPIWEFPGRG